MTTISHLYNRPGHVSPIYRAWQAMMTRCYNENNPSFPHYGGRGIKVCGRWRHSFENFLIDMGEKPSPELSLDRIDNDGDYQPDNCRWATKSDQMKNRRPFRASYRPLAIYCKNGHQFPIDARTYQLPNGGFYRVCIPCVLVKGTGLRLKVRKARGLKRKIINGKSMQVPL